MSAHTQAPWRVEEEGGEFNIRATEGREDDWYVATAHEIFDRPDVDTRRANATLIAAAPDLLTALKRLTDRVDPGTKTSHTIKSFSEAIDAARAAIAKAEGKS